jgi:DNA-binding MarR family transcriptional regulator
MESYKPLGMLVSIIHRHHNIALNKRLKHLDISAGQFHILLFISLHKGINQDKLAQHFHIDKATIARAVHRLDDWGFICRRTDPENRRTFGIFLTEKGKRIVTDIIEIDKTWESEVIHGLSDEEQVQFFTLLDKIAANSLSIAHSSHDK